MNRMIAMRVVGRGFMAFNVVVVSAFFYHPNRGHKVLEPFLQWVKAAVAAPSELNFKPLQ